MPLALFSLALFAAACSSRDAAESSDAADAILLDTRTRESKAQYRENLSFVTGYTPQCAVLDATLPRVLVAGYGRFQGIEENLTGLMVASLVGGVYPRPVINVGKPIPPAAVAMVRTAIVNLSGQRVNLCGLVLPVYWDLAPLIVEKESIRFTPQVVLLNGVAGSGDPVRFELGSANQALPLLDGSDLLAPRKRVFSDVLQPIVRTLPTSATEPSRFPYVQARQAVEDELAKISNEDSGAFDRLVAGVGYAPYPSEYLTYLCNNVVYVTNYLASHPGVSVRLMESSSSTSGVSVLARGGDAQLVRTFVHWPHLEGVSDVAKATRLMRALLAAAVKHRGSAVSGESVRADLP